MIGETIRRLYVLRGHIDDSIGQDNLMSGGPIVEREVDTSSMIGSASVHNTPGSCTSVVTHGEIYHLQLNSPT